MKLQSIRNIITLNSIVGADHMRSNKKITNIENLEEKELQQKICDLVCDIIDMRKLYHILVFVEAKKN